MQTELKEITPAIAEEYLSKNVKNRNLGKSRVEGYARDIEEGRWLMNPNPIVFDVEGNLIDGQHRLHAIIMAKKAVTMFVVHGIPVESINIIDFGKPRSSADILKIEGYPSANHLAALAKRIIGYEGGENSVISTQKNRGGVQSAQYSSSTKTEVVEYVKEHSEHLHDLILKAQTIYDKTNLVLMSPSEIGFMLHVLKPAEKALEFMNKVVSGIGLNEDTAELAIRKILERVRYKRDFPISPTEFLQYFKVAFDKYLSGTPVKILRIKSED